MALNTCALYGASNYANNWIGINLLIVLTSMAIVAAVYSLSRFLPGRTRGRITEMTRSEITQSILSVLIIAILIGSAQVACNATATIGSSILTSVGVPASQASLSPFQYADYYIGNLALHTGISVLTNIYSESISYAIGANIYAFAGTLLSSLPYAKLFTGDIISSVGGAGILRVGVTEMLNFYIVLRILSDAYLVLYAPFATIVIGALFLQYLAIPLLQYTAFVVVLPVAIAMRSLSFSGSMLRNTSNTVLAIAIAAYIIYPLTVLFDSYAMYWMFSSANPTSAYLNVPYTLIQLQPNAFYSQTPSSAGNMASQILNKIGRAHV